MLSVFKGIHHGIGAFGKIISSIINSILLLIVFILGIGLVSLISKIFSKKFLNMKMKNDVISYWIDSPIKNRKERDYYRPF